MMFRMLALLVAVLALAPSLRAQNALTTGFSYQGVLKADGVAATGLYDFRFRLYAGPIGGTSLAATLCADNTPVEDGLFRVELDFGSVYDGDRRFLEIQVRPAEAGDCASPVGFVTLAPRQELTVTPHAARALFANSATNSSTFAGLPPAAFATLEGNNVFTQTNVFAGNFTGVGCSTRLTGFDAFGVQQNEFPGDYTGMYVRATNQTSRPFYGFDAGGSLRWWMYLNGSDNTMRLANGPDLLAVNATGSVGLGTNIPLDRLDVRGNIRFGTSGDQLAVGAPSPVRMIAGRLASNGTALSGAGYTSTRIQVGYYRITFNQAFPVAPVVTATPVGGARLVYLLGVSTNIVDIITQNTAGTASDIDLCFTVVGQR